MSSDNVPAVRAFSETLSSPQMKQQIASLLPPGVSQDRFTRTTVVAINTNPDLLSADRQSLYNAISRCAADGLMPDSREAALVIYNEKVGNDQWKKAVRCMPMVEGIIKQMAKAGYAVYAVSVYENDEVKVYNDDDGQHFVHSPQPFKPRGNLVGVAAVARKDGTAFVETMTVDEIEKVKASSKMANKGAWVQWYDRMGQKSVLHRLKKRLPILDAALADSLRDPEEDPELDVVVEATEKTSEAPRPEQVAVAAVQSKKRPRGLQTVLEESEPPIINEGEFRESDVGFDEQAGF